MRPDDQIRLLHLRQAATKAIDFSKGKQRQDLDDDELLRLALTKLVEIVGEAAKSISPESRSAMPQVPWRAAARMRDRLVHHYFDINPQHPLADDYRGPPTAARRPPVRGPGRPAESTLNPI